VTGLQSAFNIKPLLEILESFQKIRVSSSTVPESSSLGSGANHCAEHGEEFKLFCETCDDVICCECVIKGAKHESHDYGYITNAFEMYKEEISSLLVPMEIKLATMNKSLELFDLRSDEITEQRAAIEATVSATFGRLHEVLEARRAQVIIHLGQITESKLKCLASQKDQVEMMMLRLHSCLDVMKESVKVAAGSERKVLKTADHGVSASLARIEVN